MRLLLAVLPLVLVACDASSDETGPSDSDADTDTDTDITYDDDIQPIWDTLCGAGCHMGGTTSGNLDLSPGHSYADIVNVASKQAVGLDRVEPGDHLASYLCRKLEGTQVKVGGSGVQMPMGGSLPSGDMEIIETWINAGAAP
jgi:hypothetical protein